ncbi:MAG: hypothetical protein ACR2PR_09310 [Pseudohongiellaceae bacterium]
MLGAITSNKTPRITPHRNKPSGKRKDKKAFGRMYNRNIAWAKGWRGNCPMTGADILAEQEQAAANAPVRECRRCERDFTNDGFANCPECRAAITATHKEKQ